jgi:hypothetical protein
MNYFGLLELLHYSASVEGIISQKSCRVANFQFFNKLGTTFYFPTYGSFLVPSEALRRVWFQFKITFINDVKLDVVIVELSLELHIDVCVLGVLLLLMLLL